MKRLLALLSVALLGGAEAQFADVPNGHPSESSILKLTQFGVLTGFPDGRFKGQRKLTRYELALILSRLWDNLSLEQLDNIWSEVVALETQIAELRQQSEQVLRNEANVADLERALRRLEERTLALDDRTANIRLTREDLTEVERTLGALTAAVKNVRGQLQGVGETQGEASGALNERLQRAEGELNMLTQRVGAQDQELGALTATLEQLPRDVDAVLDSLRDEFVAAEEAAAYTAQLSAAGGVLGDRAAYALSGSFSSAAGVIDAELTDEGINVYGRGVALPGFSVGGIYEGENEPLGLATLSLDALPALHIGAFGGNDKGLAFGAFAEHLGDEEGAALPGLDLLVSVDAKAEGGGLVIQGSGGLTFDGGSYRVRPGGLYRRQSGTGGYNGFVGELGVAFDLPSVTLSAAGRYGRFAPLSGPGRGVSEGELRLDFDSGLSVLVQADADLPELGKLGTFSERSPLDATQLNVGVLVGYTITLPPGQPELDEGADGDDEPTELEIPKEAPEAPDTPDPLGEPG